MKKKQNKNKRIGVMTQNRGTMPHQQELIKLKKVKATIHVKILKSI
ncbi:hypothetical protein [Bacillus toyonensis]|nr:hypothetical protein [Bacillus toyonensis]